MTDRNDADRPARSAPASVRVTLRAGEYVLSRAALAYMDTMARAVAPLLAPLHDRCCGCSGTVCCSCGEGPCSTS